MINIKILGKNGIGSILKIALIISFIVAVPLIVVAPFIIKLTEIKNTNDLIIMLYPSGITLLIIVYQFIKLFKSLEKENPFTYDNVKTLKITSIVSLITSLFWIFDLLYFTLILNNNYTNYIIVLSFLFILFFGVFIALYILSELFKSAVKYKEENDLTI